MQRPVSKTIVSLACLALAIMIAEPARSGWGHGHGFHGGHHFGHGFGHHGGHHLGHGFGHHGHHLSLGLGHHGGHYLGFGYTPYAYYHPYYSYYGYPGAYYSPYGYDYDHYQPYPHHYYCYYCSDEHQSHVHGYTFYPSRSPAAPAAAMDPYPSDLVEPAVDSAGDREAASTRHRQRSLGSEATPQHLADHGAAASAQGWKLLASDRPRDALLVFATQATRHPTEGVPKLGYAITSAALGDLDRGTWAMRRAFRIDPSAVHHVQLDAAVQRTVRHLVARYQDLLTRGDRDGDVSFTLAALYDLLHDVERARNLLAVAIARGDGSASAANLHLIFERDYPRAVSGGGSEKSTDDSPS